MSAARRLAGLAALASAACSQRPSPPSGDAAPPAPPSASAAIVEGPAPAAADAGRDAAGEGGAAAGVPAYSREGIKPLAPDCRRPHAYLGVAPYEQGSLQRRVQQAMAAHPEIEVVAGEPGPHQVKLTTSDYGIKYFARENGSKNRVTVIASCGDADTCLEVAAMVRAVVPDVEPELFCGHPPGLVGDGLPLRGPWKLPDALPNLHDRLEVCARVTACSVRAAGAKRDAAWRACWKAPVKDVGPCAGMLDCVEVARCFGALEAP